MGHDNSDIISQDNIKKDKYMRMSTNQLRAELGSLHSKYAFNFLKCKKCPEELNK